MVNVGNKIYCHKSIGIGFDRLKYVFIQIVHISSNIYPLEVVGGDSETQLQVGRNLDCII